MLVEKEVISPGTYWYTDEKTGLPRKLVVTPEMTKYWHTQGGKMLSAGLTIPVPYEHDFQAHPMTPKEKLLNNAGEVKEYRLKDILKGDPLYDPKRGEVKDSLWSVVDVQDPDVKKKIGHSIRWTSPWINSFTDGEGRQWNNVISHLALTTRPRVTRQTPFQSIAAALSLATEIKIETAAPGEAKEGLCLTRAGRLVERKKTKKVQPQYPIAFSIVSGGIKFDSDDGGYAPLTDDGDDYDDSTDDDTDDSGYPINPLDDQQGDLSMEELLCDLLCVLGVHMPDNCGPDEFKRCLYEGAMQKIKELTDQAKAQTDAAAQNAQGNTTSPAADNPLIQQEQQPMFMSLEDINKIADPTMKGIALSMYNEHVKLTQKLEANEKTIGSLRDKQLKDASVKRAERVDKLSKVSPRVKADLEAMVALPSMALSMGDGGVVVDPMEQTLAVLEKGLADMPKYNTLLTGETIALDVQPHPTDEGTLTTAQIDELADGLSRMMGFPPEQKRAG